MTEEGSGFQVGDKVRILVGEYEGREGVVRKQHAATPLTDEHFSVEVKQFLLVKYRAAHLEPAGVKPDEPRRVSDIPLPFPVWAEKSEPVYRCQSVTCGAYSLRRHLVGLVDPLVCGCGASVMQCGDDVPANQYRTLITKCDEYHAENKTLDSDVRRLEARLAEADRSINRLEAELERVRQAKSEFATGYFLQTKRVQQCKDVIDAHVRRGAALEEVFLAELELLRTCRKAGLDTHVPRLEEIEDAFNEEPPLDVDMVDGFGSGDKVRVIAPRFESIPVGTLGEVDSVWPALDSHPIVVTIRGREVGTRYAFNSDELEKVEEDIF